MRMDISLDPDPEISFGANTAHRIMARRQSGIEPLIPSKPIGPTCPSSSLLVERFELDQADGQTHVHVNQVIALFLTATTVRHSLDGGKASAIKIRPGQAVVCVRNIRESICWESPASILCVRVSDAALRDAARSLLGSDRFDLRPAIHVADARIIGLLHALEQERARSYPGGILFTDGIEIALAAALATSSNNYTPRRENKGGLTLQCLRRVREFMWTNVAEQVTLKSLAACAGLSPSHFAHQFRASTGTSPCKYMLALRVERSKCLLKNARISILEAALATGFENQQHFSTVFRRIVGVNPSSYRRQM